jgi:hypothetical protein
MPSGPVTNPEIGRPGAKAPLAAAAPWKISSRLRAGSSKTI